MLKTFNFLEESCKFRSEFADSRIMELYLSHTGTHTIKEKKTYTKHNTFYKRKNIQTFLVENQEDSRDMNVQKGVIMGLHVGVQKLQILAFQDSET